MFEISAMNSVFNVSTLATFKGKEIEEGYALVRKIEKGTGLESKGVIVPMLKQDEIVAMMENGTVFEAICGFVQSQVEEVIKEKIAKGASVIVPADFSLDQLVEYLSAEEVKQGRVSKEKIAAWFDSQVAYTLKQAFTEKLGQVENDKMLGILQAYKVHFTSLAKRELSLQETVKVNLGKALELLPDSTMKQYCKDKIAASVEKSADMLAL